MITQPNGKVDKKASVPLPRRRPPWWPKPDWLANLQVGHVAMESTGVFWRPIYTVLEDQFELLLANAHEIKALPGRKTDVRDCEWIADLLRHGLIRPSFIPASPVRVLRDLMRSRKSLVYQHTQEINRFHKVLETANMKLTSVVWDVWGKSGQSMIKAIMQGESDAQALAELARGTLRGKLPQLQEALQGRIQPHHRVLLQQIFAHLQFLESSWTLVCPGNHGSRRDLTPQFRSKINRLAEHLLRRPLVATEQTIPNQLNKPTNRPTTRRIFHWFEGLDLLHVRIGSGFQTQVLGLRTLHQQVLRLLGPLYSQCYFFSP